MFQGCDLGVTFIRKLWKYCSWGCNHAVAHKRWATVRIATELVEPLEEVVKQAKDEFGIPLFRSKADAVTKAVKEFLRKYRGRDSAE